ncbi:S41 family peptidase [Arcticibacter eurypsychrophilus]|uniref:S41 family peptidase n=1 Tax=Arcticibacter eurypsychrophilus TaxID=1434752 RepID=UPI00084D4297|nr:S41 family peptidase [Arcticibacter eurypsychrophilus]
MKPFTTLTILVFYFFANTAVANNKDTEQTATFIKIWGFLKYYHPTIAKGKIDWDEAFRTGIKAVRLLESKEEVNNYYKNWIIKLGKIERCQSCQVEVDSNRKYNLNMGWLKDSVNFDKELIIQLIYIQKNRNQGQNYYVSQVKGVGNTEFKNEKVYRDSIYPSPELRLLTLARYWNIVEYFYPYRYKTDQNWETVLTEMVPKFATAPDTTTYHLAILELTAKVDDSHAKFSTRNTNKYFGFKWAPFSFKIIDNKAVVTGFYNDSLSVKDDVRIGDVFLKVNGMPIAAILKENSRYIGASNEAVKKRDMHNILFNGKSETVETEFERNGVVSKKRISRIGYDKLNYKSNSDIIKDCVKVFEGNVGYINLGNLQQNQVKSALAAVKNTKAIIFDIRNYPNQTMYLLADFLNDDRKAFVKATVPDINYPGTFNFSKEIYCGRKNLNYYSGKVILLCNETTQSHAEFTMMALQTAPNVTIVGSQTSGADGNVSLITLPGAFKTWITGIGIYYPNERETQRIGIIPDVIVRPTIAGIRLRKDEVMEKAMEIVTKN